MYASPSPTTTLCVAKSSTIGRAVDLEGPSVAVISLGSLMSANVKSWLTQNGADIDKVHFVEMPFPQMPGALARGAIAAACLSEPIMSDATHGDAKVFAKPYDAIANRFNISDWFTTRDWLDKTATSRGISSARFMMRPVGQNTHRDDSAVILAKYTKVGVEQIKRMNRSFYATDLQGNMVQPVLDVAFKYKSLATATSAESMIARGF